MKTTMFEKKSNQDESKKRLHIAEKMNKLEGRAIGILQKIREKNFNVKMRELWNNVKGPNVEIIGSRIRQRGSQTGDEAATEDLVDYTESKAGWLFRAVTGSDAGCPQEGADLEHYHEQYLSESLSSA